MITESLILSAILFVIMLLNLGDVSLYADRPQALGRRRVALGAGAAAALLVTAAFSVGLRPVLAAPGAEAPLAYPPGGIDELDLLAEVLFSRYALAFEASSLLLLATMIAVILLAKRERGAAREERAGWPWQREVGQ